MAETTCRLCWYEFPTVEELVQHEEMEESVDWHLDGDPSEEAVND